MKIIARILLPIFDWLGFLCDTVVIWCQHKLSPYK